MLKVALPLSLALTLTLTACATKEYFWKFPQGGNEQQFRQDQYACLQESQQISSTANVNAFGGNAQSGSHSNYSLYQACMQARGYTSVVREKGATPTPISKKPAPDNLYKGYVTRQIIASECLANGSVSSEMANRATKQAERLMSVFDVDQQKMAETWRSERGYVLGAKDCDKMIEEVKAFDEWAKTQGG